MIYRWLFRLIFCTACAASLGAGKGDAASPDPRRWAWLKDTVWYVPANGLPAVATNPDRGKLVPLLDQTVYVIEGYRYGYFWGMTRVQFWPPQSSPVPPATPPSCLRLLGSVTPEGTISLSFTPLDDSVEPTTGAGVMRRRDDAWTMENQMISTATVQTGAGSRLLQIAHWAYMNSCPPSGACPLPGITADARQFIAACY